MLQLIANNETIEDFGDGKINKTIMFKAQSGDSIIIKDLNENIEKTIETKKVDYDLYIFENSVNVPSIIIKDYFAIDEISIYAYNTNGILVNTSYTQINNIDGFLKLAASERITINNGPLALGGLAIGVVGTIAKIGAFGVDAPTLSISDGNNGKPIASGVAEANSIVTITWSDGTKTSSKSDNDGNYYIKSPTIQSDGNISVTQTDVNGNESIPFITIYKNTQTSTISTEEVDTNNKPTNTNENHTKETPSTKETPNIQPEQDDNTNFLDGNIDLDAVTANLWIIDFQPPTATITIDDTKLTINETSTITITFSEFVLNFNKEDVIVENGTISDFTTTDNITWTAIFTPTINVEDNINSINLINNYFDIANNIGATATSENYEVNTMTTEDLFEDQSCNDIESLLQYMPKDMQIYNSISKNPQEDLNTDDHTYLFENKSTLPSDINLSFFNANDEEIITAMLNQAMILVQYQ